MERSIFYGEGLRFMSRYVRVVVLLWLSAFAVQAAVVYQDDFDGAAGDATNSVPEITLPGWTARSNTMEIDGGGKLESSDAGNPIANYRFMIATDPLTDNPTNQIISWSGTIRTPTNDWIIIGFHENNMNNMLTADINSGPFLRFERRQTYVSPGNGTANHVSLGGTHQPGDILNVNMEYNVLAKTLDVWLNGVQKVNDMGIVHEFPVGTPADPVIHWAQVQFRYQPRAAGGGAYVDDLKIEVGAATEPEPPNVTVLITNTPPELKEIDVDYEYSDRLVVMLMGDPQLPMTEESEANVIKAMDDIKDIQHDFMAVLGDLIQPVTGHSNRVTRYNMYSDLVLKPATKPVFSISGNADYGVGLDYYQQVTGLPNHYVVKRRGIRFIFLGTTQLSGDSDHICHVGEEGMQFLEEELNKDKESTTVIFQHSPVQDTTYMSGEGARRTLRHEPVDLFMGESERMRQLMKDHDNIKMFACGHVHYLYGAEDTDGRGAYHTEDGVLHVTVGASANDRGSSMVEFRDDSITVRVRDHDTKTWKDEYQVVVPIQTTFKRSSLSMTNMNFSENGFEFHISGTNEFSVVIEACTNLPSGTWDAVETNTLHAGSSLFTDPDATQLPERYYRLSTP